MSNTLIILLTLCAVAGASAATAALNLGADRVRHASPLDAPPDVVNAGHAALLALALGLPSAWALAVFAAPPLAVLGAAFGLAAAVAWRATRLRHWTLALTREMQALLAVLIIQLDSGNDSLYRALESAVSELGVGLGTPDGRTVRAESSNTLCAILNRHVLAQQASGIALDEALALLAHCRLLRDVPLVQDACARLADLVARNVPTAQLVEVLRLMDTLMTDIMRIEQEQAAQSAQTRYSTYAVALLVAGMAGTLFFVARDLGGLLLHTPLGNLTLIGVALAVATSLIAVERALDSRPLRF